MAATAESAAATEAALAGIKVLDIAGTIATGYCGKLFADHGADVINVEPPVTGFETRRDPPFIPGRRGARKQRPACLPQHQQGGV